MKKEVGYSKVVYIIILLIIGIFYFFILGESDPCLMRDSEAFLTPNDLILKSYWLYAIFLKMCRVVSGGKDYLYVAYIFQGIFGMISSVVLTEYFRKYYKIGYMGAILIYVFTLLPYGYSLPENVVTHHIMTEGVAIPLFHICILFACKSFLEKKYGYMLIVVLTGILLVLTRSHLLVLMPAFFLLLMGIFAKKWQIGFRNMTKKGKRYKIALAISTTIVVCSVFFSVFIRTNIGSQFSIAISGRVMCLMEYEDRELFEGEIQEVYDALYMNADKGEHLAKYFRTDSWRSYDIALHTNENTKEGLRVIREFYHDKYPQEVEGKYNYKSYMDMNSIVVTLLCSHILDYIIMSIQLMTQSFVASVFIQPDAIRNLCYIIAFLIYMGTFGTIYYENRRLKVERKYIIPISITLVFLVTNVVLTNIVFYGLQRYVIYTFGMFYISWFIMLLGIWRKWRKSSKTDLLDKK